MRRLLVLIGAHLLVSATAAAIFAHLFGQNPRVVAAHLLLVVEWDLALVAVLAAVASVGSSARVTAFAGRLLLALTCLLQTWLYVLNAISNLSWDRNMTAHLVAAFAPTIWSGKEPFPVGAFGITLFTGSTLVVAAVVAGLCGGVFDRAASDQRFDPLAMSRRRRWIARGTVVVTTAALASAFAMTIRAGITSQSLYWKQEMIAGFFHPDGFAFEPTARRHAVAARDEALRASYPRRVPKARRKHVVLIIVDSLRADRMQVYGYPRATTPFLSRLVRSGKMKRVETAFSTCSESFCGITSTLAAREFRDISARTFQLQDVLRDEGYQTWFLLSGNHRAWNGLPHFYRAADDNFFDGARTERYSMDDDRLVLEGLERVPPASADHPAFFYLHLMSTHYLGVQFPESHVFTPPDDQVSPGLEPYKILSLLNKPDRYDDKVRQADEMIRELFARLAAKGYLEDAIVVVTGDHGEGLGERHWAHGWSLYNEDIRIPLLFYDVPAASYPDLSFGVQVDIAPTILDRLKLPIPASWEGQSLLAPSRTRFTYHQTYFVPNRYAVLYRRDRALFKFIATPQYGKEELYDLRQDPGEARNLVDEQPDLASVLREKADAYRRDQ
jgi:membrane-anchored protein YejM (alkaline phosphatase superfamily)